MEFGITGWKYNAVMDFLASACMRWVHICEFTLSPYETANRIKELSSYFDKPDHPLHTVKTQPFIRSSQTSLAEDMLGVLPGIGRVRSEALYQHLESQGKKPFRWNITEQDLVEAPGIGKTTARKLIKCLE